MVINTTEPMPRIERVLVSREGVAVSPKRARELYRISPHVVYVRSDGWTLGAPHELEETARCMWGDHWRTRYELTVNGWRETGLPPARGAETNGRLL